MILIKYVVSVCASDTLKNKCLINVVVDEPIWYGCTWMPLQPWVDWVRVRHI